MGENKKDSSVDYSDSRFGNCFKRGGGGGGDSLTTISRDDCYKMGNSKRGRCVIINNKKFDASTQMTERSGTNVDATALQELFRGLGFDVILEHNQTVNQMTDLIKKAANEDHSNSDSFVLAVLSHGENDIVYGYDDTIRVDDLLHPLKQSSSLVGKPKFILIQACRGTNLDEGNEVAFDGDDDVVSKIPIEADYLYAYSTVPGYYAWRNSQKGSWFVQALVDVFGQEGITEQFDVLRLLTRVNCQVAYEFQSNASNMAMNRKKQVPYIASTLTKDFYLPRK